jgi:Na+:H+ antiporter, NhaA family
MNTNRRDAPLRIHFAGVRIGGPLQHAEVTVGVLLGLVIGKPLASGDIWRAQIGNCPTSARRRMGISARYVCLVGIGFTMSLFIAMLAFDETAPVKAARTGILAGSLLAGIASAILRGAAGFRNDE